MDIKNVISERFPTERPWLVMIPVKVYAETESLAIDHVSELLRDGSPISVSEHLVHGDLTAEELDESSSASRQHFIDTGRYLTKREIEEDQR